MLECIILFVIIRYFLFCFVFVLIAKHFDIIVFFLSFIYLFIYLFVYLFTFISQKR